MTDCIFCKISTKQIDAHIVYEDENCVAFDDVHPKAPIHILIIPKKHIPTLDAIQDDETLLIGHMLQTAKKIAQNLNIADDGYRIVINCNAQGGQEVYHLHIHLLSGRHMTWPPG